MYVDGTLEPRFSLESIRLWEQHTRDYVTESRAGRFRSVAYSPCGSGSSSSEIELMQ